MDSRLDIVIFGATGFTGKYTIPHVYRYSKTGEKSFTWGVAGRSEQKLRDTLNRAATIIGVYDLKDVPIIIADVEDEESIRKMTSQARVIINCCGPFDWYGEIVIKACIDSGTHCVDISGEFQFMEHIRLKYSQDVEEKGVYIVNACGIDCIPTDLGLVFLENNFKGTLNSVDIYLLGYNELQSPQKVRSHYTTWKSMINSTAPLKEKLYPKPLAAFYPKPSFKFPIHKMEGYWALPFHVADYNVLTYSQRYFYETNGKRPVQVRYYILMASFVLAIFAIVLGLVFFLLAKFKCGRKLLLQYPELFSCGYFSHTEPTEDVMKYQRSSRIYYGKGWNDKFVDRKCKTPPNRKITGRVTLPTDISLYDYTALALTLSGVMILNEPEQLPAKGGIYTPAVAFSKTSLLEELQRNGNVFEIVSNKED